MSDHVVNPAVAPARREWFVRHSRELAVVALPVPRPLRLRSIVVVLRRTSLSAFRGRVAMRVVAGTALLVLVAGIAALDAEQNAPGADITHIGEAWWWASATITTVGYGDSCPVMLAGRRVAVVLGAAGWRSSDPCPPSFRPGWWSR